MQSNQLVKGSGQKPLAVNSGRDQTGDVYLSHREFVSNVFVTYTNTTAGVISATAGSSTPVASTFAADGFAINAALSKTFPWLSQVASNFTLYAFEGLVFEYRPLSGEYGNLSTNALGKIVMTTQYDPDAPNFTSSIQAENYDYTTACKPSEHMLHGVETKYTQKQGNMLYTRTATTSKDKVLTDLGLFQLITEGVPFNITNGFNCSTSGLAVNATSYPTIIGELWVSYRVKLSRANLFTTLSNTIAQDYFVGRSSSTNALGDSVAYTTSSSFGPSFVSTNLLGTQGCPRTTNTIGGQLIGISTTGIQYYWPVGVEPGYYRITITGLLPANAANYIGCASATASYAILTAPLGTTFNTGYNNVGSSATTAYMSIESYWKVQNTDYLQAGALFTFNVAVPTQTVWNCHVEQIDASLYP